uniref:Uncharacterized protein n=1 Tax=Parascaris univalens TaxID=6257 RepID=A0A915AGE7_PARUN
IVVVNFISMLWIVFHSLTLKTSSFLKKLFELLAVADSLWFCSEIFLAFLQVFLTLFIVYDSHQISKPLLNADRIIGGPSCFPSHLPGPSLPSILRYYCRKRTTSSCLVFFCFCTQKDNQLMEKRKNFLLV